MQQHARTADLRPGVPSTSRYRNVRARSEALCAPLATDDYQVQSVLETSPPKWHLAHLTWFFETFVLAPYAPGYRVFHPRYGELFNSYYQTVGQPFARPSRHVLSRPTVEEVYRYRAHVDAAMLDLIDRPPAASAAEIARRVELGLHHEQQHQELLLMDIKHNFSVNPLAPVYRAREPAAPRTAVALRWIDFKGGLREIGADGDAFCFDNETPRHKVWLEDFRLGSRLVTNAEYLAFIEAGGYRQPQHWLADGWSAVRERGWTAPLYWRQADGAWQEFTLGGLLPLDPAAPVCHVSGYEADAYARWRGARLPTEAELEVATAGRAVSGNFVESDLLHPRAAQGEMDGQWFGDVWEWTQSAYAPYPGYRPQEGALGEYNGKFMGNQYVLRGGCCATPQSHQRASYRNFFYLHDRWPFTGIRLAAEA